LAAIARQAMIERGLEPDFPPAAQQELAAIGGRPRRPSDVRDLRDRLWASIDNDDSRDLDQLTVAESLAGGRVRILVAVADVDALVRKDSAIDGHAARNTTSVYTPAAIFPMLPEALSTDLTSLNEDQDRIAVVADMVFEADGSLATSDLYRARVRNHGKLAYRSVAAWLDGKARRPRESWRSRASTKTSASRTASRSGSWTCATATARSASRRSSRRRSSPATFFPISIWIQRTGRRS
jgi:exoribonuclease R